ncbi:hypothetical protein, partial [Micromonospora fulviviridis]
QSAGARLVVAIAMAAYTKGKARPSRPPVDAADRSPPRGVDRVTRADARRPPGGPVPGSR